MLIGKGQGKVKAVHLVGIGGAGMSALAILLAQSGYRVSGSDIHDSNILADLRAQGIRVFIGHHADQIQGVDRVISSPAIPASNDELRAAASAGISILTRAAALAAMLVEKEVICVAGSHGKTTTTAMLAHILVSAGYQPGFYLGAAATVLEGETARVGAGDLFVLEACEAFGALQHWQPRHCIITNISDEHREHYGGQKNLLAGFSALASRVESGGLLVVCASDENAQQAVSGQTGAVLTYGHSGDDDVSAMIVGADAQGSSFELLFAGQVVGEINLPVPGRHNIENALAAASMALGLRLDGADICRALSGFNGAERRWQLLGQSLGVKVFDDYAHHPREVTAVLEVARDVVTGNGRLVLIFQPQLHSRVNRHQVALGQALAAADVVFLAPIDTAGEKVSSPATLDGMMAIMQAQGCEVVRLESVATAAALAYRFLRAGDIVVTMGPGLVRQAGQELLKLLAQVPEQPFEKVASTATATELAIVAGPVISSSAPTIVHLLEIQLAKQAEAIAVSLAGRQISYAELWRTSGQLAQRLHSGINGSQKVVAVCTNCPVNRIRAFIAVLRAGHIFLPLDPRLPAARIAHMLMDSGTACLLLDQQTAEQNATVAPAMPRMYLDEEASELQSFSIDLPQLRQDQLAYIIYTSGSAGLPKACEISQQALVNLATACVEAFSIDASSRVLQAGAFGFDVAIGDMVMALCAGARLVCPANDFERLGAPLARLIESEAVTHISLTPSALSLLPARSYPQLSCVIVAGEACKPELVETWAPGRSFFNAYGPTEATIYATIAACRPGVEVMIGKPLRNVELAVLDVVGLPLKRGQKGELWIAGMGLAGGYINRPVLSSSNFKIFNLEGARAKRWYRTFDEVCLTEDGQLQYFGRLDSQIKFHGARIEAGEIEAVLRQHSEVLEAIVDIRPDTAGREQLLAWVLYRSEASNYQQINLPGFLEKHLPAFMIPSYFIPLRSLPTNLNGKLERAALPDPTLFQAATEREITAPSNAIERALLDIFKTQLQLSSELGTRHTFIEMGVDSLTVAIILLAVENQFGIEIPGEVMASASTIELLALHVQHILQQNTPAVVKAEDLDPRFKTDIQAVLASWGGHRWKADAWTFSCHPEGKKPPLFFATHAMTFGAVSQLAQQLGEDQPIYGLLSGHKTMAEYTNVTFQTVAKLYVDEIMAIQPVGSLQIGGNCGGGTLAREIALLLLAAGREVSILIMVEQGRFPAYPGRVALLFGIDSFANPYARLAEPEKIMQVAYPCGFSMHPVPGVHGAQFSQQNVVATCAVIGQLLAGR